MHAGEFLAAPTNKGLLQTIEDSAFFDGIAPSKHEDEKVRITRVMCYLYFSLTDKVEPGCEGHYSSGLLHPGDLAKVESLVLVGDVVQAAKGYFPRFNQMLTVWLMTEGIMPGSAPEGDGDDASAAHKQVTFGQVNTGQGKTLIAAMVALTLKLASRETGVRLAVGILTTNNVLTRQNYLETQDIFELAQNMLGLELKVIVFDADMTEGAQTADIIYLSPFQLSRDYAAFYKSAEQVPLLPWHQMTNREDPMFNSVVIVDEVDAILYDGVGETFLNVKPLPFGDSLARVATQIAETCAVQKNFSGVELHRLLGLGDDQPVQHQKHYETSVCEDPGVLEELREEVFREVKKPPGRLSAREEERIIGKVSIATLDLAASQILKALGNGRMYSVAELNKFTSLSKMYNWAVRQFENRHGKGKGRAHVNKLLRSGELGALKPVLDWMPSDLGCEVVRKDFGQCAEYRIFVQSQLPRWLKEARNLLGSQPMLIENHNYMLRGQGACKHLLADPGSPLGRPADASCDGMAESLMCTGDADTDLGGDKLAEIRARSCARKWIAKLGRVGTQGEPAFDMEVMDLKRRLLRLQGLLEPGKGQESRRQFLKDLRREVSFSQVIYVEHVNGLIRERTRFNGFKHLFLEYRHNGAVITQPSSETTALSRIRALASINVVLGFTGTLPKAVDGADDARSVLQRREHLMFENILKHLYGAGENKPRLVYVSPFVESQMVVKAKLEVADDREKWAAVAREIGLIKGSQCALVVVQDIATSHLAMEYLSSSLPGERPLQFIGDGRDDKVSMSTFHAGQAVVTTAVGSRGVDWDCEAPGGFEVIATYMSRSLRVQRQIQGRAARSGQKGSYIEIVSKAEMQQSMVEWGKSQSRIVRLVKNSLENDLRTDAIAHMTHWISSVGEESRDNAEPEKRFNRFRLWMTDARYNGLTKRLQEVMAASAASPQDPGEVEAAEKKLSGFFSFFAQEHDLRPLAIVDEPKIVESLLDKVKELVPTLAYLYAEVGKNAAYEKYVTGCVTEGSCDSIPPFVVGDR